VGRVAGTTTVEGTADKCLTFRLAEEVYGIGILKVQEIIGMMNVTRVPKMPPYMRGVVNLRGRIIPVLDLRQRFGVDAAEDTEVTCIIVVQVEVATGALTVGLIVDEVSEVVDIPFDQIEAVPDFGVQVDGSFIRGMGKLEQDVVLLLDIDAVLSPESAQELTSVTDIA
jgi:purine-binding chemotaxis protein CheW